MYKKGLYVTEEKTDVGQVTAVSMAHIVIGTAPVHFTDDPAAVTNTPVVCRNIAEARTKLGYSTDFEKYTLCQAMYTHFMLYGTAPVVFINVLDVTTHKTAVTATSKSVSNSTIVIDDDVIVSSLVIKQNNTAIAEDKYATAWSDGSLVVSFTDSTITGTVTVEYDKVNPAGVTAADIIGAYDTTTEKRTGIEVVNDVYAKTGEVPMLLSAPQFSETDTVGAALIAKTTEIAGCFSAFALLDLACPAGSTRASAITARRARTEGENAAYFFPRVKRGGYTISYSALAAAAIMYRATLTGGVIANGIDNLALGVDDVVLADGTPIFYNQPDGNELVEVGIITAIARGGKFYAWGNNSAAYPTKTNPDSRWINMRLAFIFTENDFIASNAGREITPRTMEDLMTDENIKLGAWSSNGYIINGSMSFLAADNTVEDVSNGNYKLRTRLAPNVNAETATNVFTYDLDAVAAAIEALAGNGGTE